MEMAKSGELKEQEAYRLLLHAVPIEQGGARWCRHGDGQHNNLMGSRISVDQAIRILEGKLEVKVASRKFSIIDSGNINTYDRTNIAGAG